eukprot:6464260-Amphidinium_carterae.1
MQAALPPHARHAHDVLESLRSLAHFGTFTQATSSLPESLGYAQQSIATSSTVQVPLAGTKWKRYHPEQTVQPTSMRAQELEWAHQWRVQLIELLKPYSEVMPPFLAAMEREHPEQELHDMFGNLRWSTLRQHHKNLHNMLRIRPDLFPLTQSKGHGILQQLEEQRVAPTKLGTWTTTLRWVQSLVGGDMSIPTLLKKKAAISERMATTRLEAPRRAHSMSIDAVRALETACVQSTSWVSRLGAGHFRFLLGASARFDDGQHTRGDSILITKSTIEFSAWQTKTMRLARARSQVLPLICPLVAFSTHEWWSTYVSELSHLSELLPERDFLLPMPSPAFASFQSAPCGRTQALNWLRSLLQDGGLPSAEVSTITLPSLRVFAADLVYAAGISRDSRRYLGRWAEAQTADVYTRDHRTVVSNIWSEMLRNQVTLQSYEPRTVAEDLQGQDYGHQSPTQTGPCGPFRLVINVGARVPMLHWLDAGDRSVGCGWKPSSRSKVQLVLSEEDWRTKPVTLTKCVHCFKRQQLPESWEAELDAQSAASESGSSSSEQ